MTPTSRKNPHDSLQYGLDLWGDTHLHLAFLTRPYSRTAATLIKPKRDFACLRFDYRQLAVEESSILPVIRNEHPEARGVNGLAVGINLA